MSELVDNFLAHYASPNYDPVKAHEYYLQNRELKGRTSQKGFSGQQKEAWSYVNNKLKNDKHTETAQAQADQKARLDQLRANTQAARERIRAQLQAKVDEVQARLKAGPGLPPPKLIPIPSDASPKVKEYLQKQNAMKLQKYSNDTNKAQAQNRVQSAADLKAARDAAHAEVQRIGTELKGVLAKARSDYEAAKKERDARFASAKDQEFQKIKTELPGAAPKAKKPRAPRKPRQPAKKGQPRAKSKSQQQIEQLQQEVQQLRKGG